MRTTMQLRFVKCDCGAEHPQGYLDLGEGTRSVSLPITSLKLGREVLAIIPRDDFNASVIDATEKDMIDSGLPEVGPFDSDPLTVAKLQMAVMFSVIL